MKKSLMVICLIFAGICVLLSGCGQAPVSVSKEVEGIAVSPEQFIKDHGYEMVSSEGKVQSYVLKKDRLTGHESMIWAMQKIKPENYLGRTIELYGFTVKNHFLDNARDNNKHQTKVWIMGCEGKVIGGYSLPDYDEVHYGGVYSLEGKTLEEVTGKDFQTWREEWEKKYSIKGDSNVSENSLSIKDYMPSKKISLKYSGGFENAGFERTVQMIDKDRIQMIQSDTGTSLVMVYELTEDEIKLVYSKEEAYGNKNYLDETNRSEVILKAPLKTGTSWVDSSGRQVTITGVGINISTSSGRYKAIEVTTAGKELEIKNYYAPDVGLVKNIFSSQGRDTVSELIKVENVDEE